MILFSLFFFLLTPQLANAQQSVVNNVNAGSVNNSEPVVSPPDIFVRVALVLDELELIRLEMGRPADIREPPLLVTDTTPNVVYFQALSLFDYADQLGFEWSGSRTSPPDPPESEILPVNVKSVVDATLQRLQVVKEHLGITQSSTTRQRDPALTPADVFNAIYLASQRLDRLLDQHRTSADAFENITLALAYSTRLRARAPGVRIPAEPLLERGKRSNHVYISLVESFHLLQKIANQLGVKLHSVKLQSSLTQVKPSDVYDLASLLVANIRYVLIELDGPQPIIKSYYPGRRLPSQVLQRAKILHAQLAEYALLPSAKAQ